jgi:hypothetical protein
MNTHWIRSASLLLGIATSAAFATPARASNIASSMWACTAGASTTNEIDRTNPGSNNNFGQVVVSPLDGFPEATFICPALNISSISSTTLRVDSYKQANDSVRARACVAYVGGFGGNCGALDSNNSTGNVTIQPSTTVWTSNPTSYRWIEVVVKRPASGTNNVWGYRQD